jgi:DnaJ-like protein
MGFTSWVDQQIADAERRGVFDDLPGAGKPLNLKPSGEDYGEAWVRDYARREGVEPDEFLPTPLRLRREIERLNEAVGGFRSEAEIREIAGDINRRIVEWRRIPEGPPLHVRLVNADDLVARWRAAQANRPSATGPRATAQPSNEGGPRRPRRWWRREGKRALSGGQTK